jgi:protein-disulfide isomerase
MAKVSLKKVQIVDVLMGAVLGIILTALFMKFALPYISSSKKVGDISDQSSPSQNVTTTIDSSPYLGNKDKVKVAIVEFSDFECPYCQQFLKDTFDQIIKNYVDTDKIIFVYRNLPLPLHEPAAEKEANATLCVKSLADNNAYFKMVHFIYENSGLNGKGMSDDDLIKFAKQAGADQSKFETCLNSDQNKDAIQKDTDAANEVGISGTPSFVVGKLGDDGKVTGELLVGAQPYSEFETVINKYLK